jgi:5'-nucleotidase
MGSKKYRPEIIIREDPRGEKYYWIGIGNPVASPEADTDIKAVAEGYISITPIHSDMTSYEHLEELRSFFHENS